MSKLTKVGITPVTKDLTVVYYISSLDESGRENQWGHTKDGAKARRAFKKAKKTEYDMHLYVALVKNYGSDDEVLIDGEVLDSFSEDRIV